MRLALVPLLGSLIAAPAMAQGYYPPASYGYAAPAYRYVQPAPTAWDAARMEWHRAHRAEEIARWRAANGDYWGAERAEHWANQHRERARWDAGVARGGW
jgi:hypothetical protein